MFWLVFSRVFEACNLLGFVVLGLFGDYSTVFVGVFAGHCSSKLRFTEFLSKLKMLGKESDFNRSLRGLNSDLNSRFCSKLSGEKCAEQRRDAAVGVKSVLFTNFIPCISSRPFGNVKKLTPDFEELLQFKAAQTTLLVDVLSCLKLQNFEANHAATRTSLNKRFN